MKLAFEVKNTELKTEFEQINEEHSFNKSGFISFMYLTPRSLIFDPTTFLLQNFKECKPEQSKFVHMNCQFFKSPSLISSLRRSALSV